MTFVNESGFATVPSCTVSGFLSGIHTVMTFALKKQKRLCRRTVLCGQQTGFTPVEENSLVMTFASESGFATMLWSKHFATQNGLRPPRFLRGAYLHGQQFQGFSRWNELFMPLFKQVEILISTQVSTLSTPSNYRDFVTVVSDCRQSYFIKRKGSGNEWVSRMESAVGIHFRRGKQQVSRLLIRWNLSVYSSV